MEALVRPKSTLTYLIPTSKAEFLFNDFKHDGCRVAFTGKNKDGKKHFPDGEVYVKVDNLSRMEGNKAVVVHTGYPDQGNGVMELEMILGVLKNAGIEKEVFFTYYPFGRQDNEFTDGELNVARSLLDKLVNYWGVKKVYAIDAHFFGDKSWLKEYPFVNVSAAELLKNAARKDCPDIVFIGPDKGAHERFNIDSMSKTRRTSYDVDVECNEELFKGKEGKTVGVIDDIIGTGGTMVRCRDKLIDKGAKNAVALIVHGVIYEGILKVEQAYSKLYMTNSINREEANVDITDLIVSSIR
jgi:ribose-phosphate pyrophosphokinase